MWKEKKEEELAWKRRRKTTKQTFGRDRPEERELTQSNSVDEAFKSSGSEVTDLPVVVIKFCFPLLLSQPTVSTKPSRTAVQK